MIVVMDLLLFAILVIVGIALVERLLPHRYLRVRLRKHLSLERMKEQPKEKNVQPKKTFQNGLFLGLEAQLQAASIFLTPVEFLRLVGWGNGLLLLVGLVFGAFLEALALCLLFDGAIYFVLKGLAQRRKRKMIQQLPDALTLMSNAMKSGYSILQTIDLVSKEDFVPLSYEFAHLVQALKFGESFEKAFRDFADRVELSEVTTVVDTILITRETGGNMTMVIDGLVEMLQENDRLEGEIRSLSAQGKMSAWIVGSMPTVLFLAMFGLNREYMMAFFEVGFGIAILAFAATMQFIGVMFLRKIIRLKVR